MKSPLPIRITVLQPPNGVLMQVQRGRTGLLPPVKETTEAMVFDFPITVDLKDGSPNFLGEYAQGPKASRFVYVNSGTLAGQTGSCWTRRAKVSLMDISREQIEKVLSGGDRVLEAKIRGTARDGGPACASCPSICGWLVVAK